MFFFSSRRRHTRLQGDWSSDVCSSDLNVIPQAHPTGYPLYRLEWQNLGSLQRRLRNCLVGIRAEPYDYGAPRSGERRVGEECRSRWSPDHLKKKKKTY